MRVFRQWRDLILRKRAGHGHEPDVSPSNAGLALFCPACPQPGINTPDNWTAQPRSELYSVQSSYKTCPDSVGQLDLQEKYCG
jgi:hypothetical protein